MPPIVAVYFGGLFWTRFTAAGAFWGIAAGLGVGLALFLAKEVTGAWAAVGLPPVHFTYMAIVMFALSFAVMTLISLAGAAPEAKSQATFRWSDLAPGPSAPRRGWAFDYRVQAAGLFVLMAVFIAVFW